MSDNRLALICSISMRYYFQVHFAVNVRIGAIGSSLFTTVPVVVKTKKNFFTKFGGMNNNKYVVNL